MKHAASLPADRRGRGRRRIVVAGVGVVWLIGWAGTGPAAAAQNYTLVRDGQAQSAIVVREQAGPVERHAAGELAAYMEKITGARLEIGPGPAAGRYPIYLGTLETEGLPLTADMRAAAERAGEEGYVLAADANGLRIVGRRPVGVLYGVYTLLKRYGDVRWFFPGPEGEYCPRRPSLAVEAGVTVGRPSFSYRRLNLVCANINSRMVDTWDWLVRNGMQITLAKHLSARLHPEERLKRGALYTGGGHAFSYLISDRLFDEHPEYFALIDGQRVRQAVPGRGDRYQPCTSNPAVVEIMTAKLLEWGEIPPRGGAFLIGNNDSPGWCQCAACARLDPPEEKAKGFVSTRYWTLLNAIAAKALAANPDLKLLGWAYQNFQEPPVGIVPDKRFSVLVCVHQRCYRHAMADERCPANARFRRMLGQWVKLNPIATYEYTDILPAGEVLYLPLERVFVQDLKYYHRIGLCGAQTEIPPPDGVFGPAWNNRKIREMWRANWAFVYLMAYFLWDVEADYDAVYEDMGAKWYGAAWPVMKQYRAELRRAYEETPGDMIYGTPDIALGKCLDRPGLEATLSRLLDEAEAAAAGNDALRARIRQEREYLDLSWRPMHRAYVARASLEVGAAGRVGRIVVDGRLDEPDWQTADFITGFVSLKGQPAEPQTFLRILYDPENLYFGVEALEPEPAKMKVQCDRRDGPLWTDNGVEVFVAAPTGNGRYLHLIVNSRGVVYDSMGTGVGAADVAFDSGAEVAAATQADRWVLEARVPTSGFGTGLREGDVWKLNVARNRHLTDGTSENSSICGGAYHGVEAFRSVAFGGKGLIRNGDFEDVAKPSEWKHKSKWRFPTDAAPAGWSFHEYAGEAALVEGGAASGRRFLRVRSASETALAVICQALNVREAAALRVRARVRGKGTFRAVMFLYDPKTHRHVGSPGFGEPLKLDTPTWTPFEAIYDHDGKTLPTLALYFASASGMDIDDVTVMREPKTEGP